LPDRGKLSLAAGAVRVHIGGVLFVCSPCRSGALLVSLGDPLDWVNMPIFSVVGFCLDLFKFF
jgi:hypothetical protein